MLLLAALFAAPALAADVYGVSLGAGVGWFFFDDQENLESTWSAVPRLGYQVGDRFVIEAEMGIHQGQTRGWGYRYDALTPRANLLVNLAPTMPVQPFVAGGPGIIYKRVSRDPNSWSETPIEGENIGNYKNPDTDALLNVGPGLLVPLGGAAYLRGDLRYVFNVGTEPHGEIDDRFNNWEVTLGFSFRAAERRRDTDHDGFVDRLDPCPEDPEDYDRYEDDDGCPDDDNDRDRIVDWEDDCPDEAEDFDDYRDSDGCPEDDNDHDGLVDFRDRCPNDPEDLDGFMDDDGCPDRDNDRDGILDLDDRCPLDPEDMDGFMDEDGCVDRDNDGDGMADERDACPNEAETYNAFEDLDGCPDDAPELPEEIERFTGVIQGINFEVNKAVITLDSYGVLDEAADVLVRYPDVRIEVQGHTDSDGSEDYNFKLSDERAEAVVRYLINRGVDSRRLTWMGYGEARPLVPNDSEEGKAVNRRVEFRIVES
ncbi:MAG: OmpA family protein [Alphaproteobacteria bacterium]|nr:OmpA family protein [Alphaproteobacteria bacterium]